MTPALVFVIVSITLRDKFWTAGVDEVLDRAAQDHTVKLTTKPVVL